MRLSYKDLFTLFCHRGHMARLENRPNGDCDSSITHVMMRINLLMRLRQFTVKCRNQYYFKIPLSLNDINIETTASRCFACRFSEWPPGSARVLYRCFYPGFFIDATTQGMHCTTPLGLTTHRILGLLSWWDGREGAPEQVLPAETSDFSFLVPWKETMFMKTNKPVRMPASKRSSKLHEYLAGLQASPCSPNTLFTLPCKFLGLDGGDLNEETEIVVEVVCWSNWVCLVNDTPLYILEPPRPLLELIRIPWYIPWYYS